MSNKSLNKTIGEVWNDEYVVPLYQRNFAWTDTQIGQLLQDIWDHAPKTKEEANQCGNYYLGSLVVLLRRDGKYEIIDGQQRLTALHMICRYLGLQDRPRLTYDSRPAVERFLEELFASDWKAFSDRCKKANNNKTSRFVEALDTVETFQIRIGAEEKYTSLKTLSEDKEKMKLLAEYLNNKVVLVCTPLPEDTDVASYFEIMNNRGEQLEAHEVVKALLMRQIDPLKKELSQIFATIWEACSQMEIPIQKSLSKYRSLGLFGVNYDSLCLDMLTKDAVSNIASMGKKGIDEILSEDANYSSASDAEKNDEEEIKYNAIIDFPNFLMHVFRLYNSRRIKEFDDAQSKEDKENKTPITIPLNADAMPVEAPSYITDSIDFIKFLLRARTLFDRYVLKAQGEGEEDDDNLKWRILRPYRYDGCLKYRNTFTKQDQYRPQDFNDSADEIESVNSRIVKQQSMLQVTFRNRKYKEWLYSLMDWLLTNADVQLQIDENLLVSVLDKWIFNYYLDLQNRWTTHEQDLLCAGTDTPIFMLNFIDYLYWLASLQAQSSIRYIREISKRGTFQFKYFNSVEHHLPQSYEQTDGVNLDSIGNLCLISRRKNSSLNDKGPTEKAKDIKGLQPKRLVMYSITWDNHRWGKKEIEEHQQDIVDLLSQANNLLKIEKEDKE